MTEKAVDLNDPDTWPRFRKRPVEIVAAVYDPEAEDCPYPVEPYLDDFEGRGTCQHCGGRPIVHGWIKTLEGGHIVCAKDVIIRGIKGEFYPCKPDIFEATYDALLTWTEANAKADPSEVFKPPEPLK